MSTYLQRLARWAVDLDPTDIPADVLERARLQHLALAGAVRAAAGGPAALALARSASPRGTSRLLHTTRRTARVDAARFHAAAAAELGWEDVILGGWTGAGVGVSWSRARDRRLSELLTATVVANEVAGRLGCAWLLTEDPLSAGLAVTALAAAAAAARLDGMDARATADAYALALAAPPRGSARVDLGPGPGRGLAAGAAAAAGEQAAAMARAGMAGPLDILDARDGLLGALSPLPLRAAFTGLGETWLTRTLAIKRHPGHMLLQVPIQATAEILARHIKAADKRLRKDQVQSLELKLTAPALLLERAAAAWPGLTPAGLTRSIPRALGALLTAHELGPAQLTAAWLEENRDSVARIASTVSLSHDWKLTLEALDQSLSAAAPLFAGVTAGELRAHSRRLRQRYEEIPLGPPAGRALVDFMGLLPGRIQDRVGRGRGDLSDLDEDAWRFRSGLDMRLYTVRGGWWPERRELPEGSPGWPWADTLAIALDKYAGGDEARRAGADALLELRPSTDALDWLEAL
jgi:2-methylcitrate dehydratase PrpD